MRTLAKRKISLKNIDQQQKTIEQIFTKTNFTPEKEIFRGQIYDHDKIGSIIYKGTWRKKTVALKIQALLPNVWVN